MKAIKFLSFALLLSFSVEGAWAREELTESQKKAFKERVTQKVEEFQNHLSKIVDKRLDKTIRDAEEEALFDLFLGAGDPYDYYDSELDKRIHSTGVKMQTSSVSRKTTSSQLLKRYVKRLYDPETGKSSLSYSNIVIESAGAVYVDNLVRVGDHYECVAYFCQKFSGFREGRVIYADETTKKIRCVIKKINLPSGESIWEAKLGDIYVLETKKL